MSELQLIPTAVATSASALLGRSVLGPDGAVCGHVKELAVDVSNDQTHVAALILKPVGGAMGKKTLLPVADVVMPVSNDAEIRAKAKPVAYREHHDYLLLDYDLLDQQIIDVDGRKVVRVNDVNLAWEPKAAGRRDDGLANCGGRGRESRGDAATVQGAAGGVGG